ncbi:MAG: hypothetical protein NW214_12555 [Pseudanabaenaceae cyanobacterium bins.39]|nr:hypothetical protein [Pseudanabaenaceae cyanobacterium bins.39]
MVASGFHFIRSPLISITKRSPKISTLPPHKRSPLNKPTTSNSDR